MVIAHARKSGRRSAVGSDEWSAGEGDSFVISRPVNPREINTTERLNIGDIGALVRYLRTAVAGRTSGGPIAVTPTFWVADAMEHEIGNRLGGARQGSVSLMRDAVAKLTRAQFCLLDGDHRALAAALLDRNVEAIVLETPGHLDEYRRQAPEFPHEAALDLRAIARKWLDYAFGSLDQSTFSVEPMTVAERAAALLEPGHLPEEARALLLRSPSPPP